MEKLKVVKQQTFAMFTIKLVKNEHDDYSVLYLNGSKQLERYDCVNFDAAQQDFNTVCDAIRNVLNVIKLSLG